MPIGIWLAALAIAASLPVAWWALSGCAIEGRAARANLASGVAMVTDLRQAVLKGSAHDRVVSPLMAALVESGRPVHAGTAWWNDSSERAFLAGLAETWPTERLLAVKAVAAVGARHHRSS